MRRLLLPLLPLLLAAAPFDPFEVATIVERPGAAVPLDLPFRDSAGRPQTLRRLGAGRPILLVPVLHDCPNFCGVTLDGLLGAAEAARLESGAATIVALGIDPREQPAAARAALARLAERRPRSAGRVAALTGADADIRRVTDTLGYRYAYDPRIGQYAHVAAVAVLTPDGRFSRWLYGIAPPPEAVSAAVADARAGRVGGLVERLILLCYHYDPAAGRYGLAIDRVLTAACLLTAALLGGYILVQRRREARRC